MERIETELRSVTDYEKISSVTDYFLSYFDRYLWSVTNLACDKFGLWQKIIWDRSICDRKKICLSTENNLWQMRFWQILSSSLWQISVTTNLDWNCKMDLKSQPNIVKDLKIYSKISFIFQFLSLRRSLEGVKIF